MWLEFPQTVQGAPDDVLTPVYYRSVLPGDEVPTGLDRNLLTFTSHSLLSDAERGAVRYFQRVADGSLAEGGRRGLRSAQRGRSRGRCATSAR